MVVSGTYNLRVRVTFHGQVGKSNWIRYGDDSRYLDTIPFVFGPCQDCSTELTIPVKFGNFLTGVREFRLSVNVPDEQPSRTGSQRMFNSTGWPVCVNSCSGSNYRGSRALQFIEARGWYDDRPSPGLFHGYQNQRGDKPEVKACGTLDIDIQPGSEGRPTVFAMVAVNPRFHSGDPGRVLLQRSGEVHEEITLPCDLVPGDRVALVGHDGKNGGVLVLRVVP